MSDKAFNLAEFIEEKENPSPALEDNFEEDEEIRGEEEIAEVDIQKAVVEELAAEKVALHEKFSKQEEEIAQLKEKLSAIEKILEETKNSLEEKSKELEIKSGELEEAKESLSKAQVETKNLEAKISEKFFDELQVLERNPNMLALIDREPELPDRYFGETRDHVLEVIKEARDESEKSGRLRRAQLLEAVLVANEPCGELKQKRAELEKVFSENANIVNGAVIKKLDELGLKYKEGDTYLMPAEIMLRNF